MAPVDCVRAFRDNIHLLEIYQELSTQVSQNLYLKDTTMDMKLFLSLRTVALGFADDSFAHP